MRRFPRKHCMKIENACEFENLFKMPHVKYNFIPVFLRNEWYRWTLKKIEQESGNFYEKSFSKKFRIGGQSQKRN